MATFGSPFLFLDGLVNQRGAGSLLHRFRIHRSDPSSLRYRPEAHCYLPLTSRWAQLACLFARIAAQTPSMAHFRQDGTPSAMETRAGGLSADRWPSWLGGSLALTDCLCFGGLSSSRVKKLNLNRSSSGGFYPLPVALNASLALAYQAIAKH